MTLRQYAAIKLKVPDSGTDWLDEMIVKSLRNDFAAKAMQGYVLTDALVNDTDTQQAWIDLTAKTSYQMTDAMIKAREAK
jgi:hypothetical protein